MIESIEQLRGMRGNYATYEDLVMRCCDIADEIEREVEERYVELPRDKSGVPIHLGDKVRTKLGSIYTVSRITREDYNGTTTWYIEDFASHYSLGSEGLTLCKPPTVEDVLREFVISLDARGHLSNGVATTIAEYAPKLQLREAE